MRRILFLLSLGFIPILLLIVWCALTVGLGLKGAALCGVFLLAWLAAIRRRGWKLFAASAGLFVISMTASISAQLGSSQMVRLGHDGARIQGASIFAAVLGALVPEREPVLVALDLRMRLDPFPGENSKIVDAMAAAYSRMPLNLTFGPTPAIATYLGLQSPENFDVLVLEPSTQIRGTAIFLHGYGGNFAVQCHLFAETVQDLGYRTLCPSIPPSAKWNDAAGRRTLEATTRFAGEEETLIVGGLSDGAVAVSRMWPKADRYILVSGVSTAAECPPAPAVAFHGTADKIASVHPARKLSRKCRNVELEALEGGHFIFASHLERMRERVAENAHAL